VTSSPHGSDYKNYCLVERAIVESGGIFSGLKMPALRSFETLACQVRQYHIPKGIYHRKLAFQCIFYFDYC
jgi:hypothetical protein